LESIFDPSGQHDNVDARIVATLERLSQVFRVRLREEARQRNLSPIQAQFLIYLLHHDVELRRVSQLAREFDLTQATVSDAVASLETKGFVRREQWPDDRRVVTLRLTAGGEKLATTLSNWADPIREHLERFSPASGAFLSCGERGRNALPDGTHGFIAEIRPHNRRQDVCDLQVLPAGRPSWGGVAAPLWASGRATRRPQSPRRLSGARGCRRMSVFGVDLSVRW
jgi:DNA-binding MarR family transcriptional regulator